MQRNGREYWNATVTLTPSAQRWHSATDIGAPYEHNAFELTLFVSCHNEEATVAGTLATIADAMQTLEKTYEIIVIDDCSQDNSVQRVREYMDLHPEMNIVLRANKVNKGLAQNYVDAAFIGRGTYFWLLHGSNRESMETLVDVLKTADDADIIMPYYLAGLKMPLRRHALSRAYTRLMNLVMRQRFQDYRCPPVHLRYNVMRWHPNASGYSFQEDLLCRLLDLGFTCKQVPCRRKRGDAAASATIGWRQFFSIFHTLLNITLRRLSRRIHRH